MAPDTPSDNPFDEPDDPDRTVIRPAPGGRPRPASPPPPARSDPDATMAGSARPEPSPSDTLMPGSQAARAAPRQPPPVLEGAETIRLGVSPLIAAAAPLLQLLGRLRNTLNPPDAGDLRERAVREMRAFEQRGREAGIAMDQLRPAHYALCASLDDVVLATPWGSSSGWDQRSLVSTFHQEVRSGERFFDLLTQMRQNPGTFLPVIELMYLCLSLGFQGRYRLSGRGPAELDRLREEVYALIVRQRTASEPALSPRWQGVAAPYRPSRPRLPLWVVAVTTVAILAGLYVVYSNALAGASDGLFERMAAAPPAQMPAITRAGPVQPPAPPPEPSMVDKLRTFLKPEIDQGLVAVLGTPAAPLVRINNRGMFASGNATVQPAFLPLLDRIASALNEEGGKVLVVGYTDNTPIRTAKFPSNFELSAARAKAAGAVLARTLKDSARITTEGRADADPIADNATPEGRDQNRRIEITLQREG